MVSLLSVSVCVCVRACVHVCVHACVYASVMEVEVPFFLALTSRSGEGPRF